MTIHKMKILDKYISPIRNLEKRREYRLNDDFRRKIKNGEGILLISNLNPSEYVKVIVKNFRAFDSWKDALKDNWKEDFKSLGADFISVLNEYHKFYRNDDVKKLGILFKTS